MNVDGSLTNQREFGKLQGGTGGDGSAFDRLRCTSRSLFSRITDIRRVTPEWDCNGFTHI